MRSAPAGIRSPFPPRGTPCPPDIFTVTMATIRCTFTEAVERLAHAAGLLPAEPTDES
jgi:Immunity protein Imm1